LVCGAAENTGAAEERRFFFRALEIGHIVYFPRDINPIPGG
jgi:hypothetical protein